MAKEPDNHRLVADKSANDAIYDAMLLRQVKLLRYTNHVSSRMVALLNKADAKLTQDLAAALARKAPQATVERIDNLLSQVRLINASAYRGVESELTKELAAFAEHEAGAEANVIRSVIRGLDLHLAVNLRGISPAQVKAAAMARPFQGRLLAEWMRDIEATRAQKIRDAVRIGIVNGDPNAKIVQTIRGTRANNYADGLLERPRQELQSVVQTAVAHVAQYARQQTVEANSDILKGAQWVATLDNHTCMACASRDGYTYAAGTHRPLDGGPKWSGGPGVIHWNCRCVDVPVLKSWRELGLRDLPKGTRASMDGQVPAEKTYAEWLADQPVDRVIDILGPARAKLYMKGGLKVGEFVNDKGRLLTLEQLKALDADAFRKTGIN